MMKGNMMPRLSKLGLALTVALGMVGWLASPAWSCPPKEKSGAPCKAGATVGKTTFEQHIAQKGSSSPTIKYSLASSSDEHSDELDERLSELESKLAQLLGQIDKLPDALPGKRHEHAPPRSPATPRALRAPRAPRAPRAIGEIEHLLKIGNVVRRYELPAEKLGALTALMARDDVPILIRPLDGAIELHATEAHQVIFELFVEMLDGTKDVRAYQLAEGKLRDLTALMGRQDVPILVEPGDGGIKLHGNALEQAVFMAFVGMIDSHEHPTMRHEAGRVSYVIDGITDLENVTIITADAGAKAAATAKARVDKRTRKAVKKAKKKMKKIRRIKKAHVHHGGGHTGAGPNAHDAMIEFAYDVELERVAAPGRTAGNHADAIRERAEELQKKAQRLMKEAQQLEQHAQELEQNRSDL